MKGPYKQFNVAVLWQHLRTATVEQSLCKWMQPQHNENVHWAECRNSSCFYVPRITYNLWVTKTGLIRKRVAPLRNLNKNDGNVYLACCEFIITKFILIKQTGQFQWSTVYFANSYFSYLINWCMATEIFHSISPFSGPLKRCNLGRCSG